ncbi:hypothetical protein [Massilia niastensis]|uniref:hypothetical protein n=1 Tax=Massilia niastensis TaxID=544911 RepID=UPI0012EB3AF7|nr:hypothetical protein [Massilia niastensis]
MHYFVSLTFSQRNDVFEKKPLLGVANTPNPIGFFLRPLFLSRYSAPAAFQTAPAMPVINAQATPFA